MTFRILALDPAPFAPLFALEDAALAERGAVRCTATAKPGFPCRVSLADAEVGETLILIGYEHLAVASPYRSRHAIYVRENAIAADLPPDTVPEVIARRLISWRAFDGDGMMTACDVVDGSEVAAALTAAFADPAVAHIDLHNAKPGCFAARAVRA